MRVRRIKPRTREGRKRAAELSRILHSSRTSKADKAAALRELDAIAPFKGCGSAGTVAEMDRVGAKQAEGTPPEKPMVEESVPPEKGTPPGLSEWLARVFTPEHKAAERDRVIRGAEAATDVERAVVLLREPENAGHKLNKLATELAVYLCNENKSVPKPDPAGQAQYIVRGWLERQPYNRADLRGDDETVSEAVADVYRLLDEREVKDPRWFVDRALRLFDGAGTPCASKPEPLPPAEPVPEESEPEPSTRSLAAVLPCADVGHTVGLILQSDGWLSRLAEFSPGMRDQINAALTAEYLERGAVGATFMATLYERLRPRCNSLFPERVGL